MDSGSKGRSETATGSGGLVANVVGLPTQSPEFEPWHELATFLWKNRRVAKDHPHAAITLSSTGTAT